MKKFCPVCRSSKFVEFFDGGKKPLATLGWPTTPLAAKNMDVFPLTFKSCLRCTHVWNSSFSYENIPYTQQPNWMYNVGTGWQEYIHGIYTKIATHLPRNPTIIDIGCGDGTFLIGLSKHLKEAGNYIGFDPSGDFHTYDDVTLIADYFYPKNDIARFKPDLIIMRHVLEHLEDPASFIEELSFAAAKSDCQVLFFAETPCVTKAIQNNRCVDFFYEHPSQFTATSFTKLMELGGQVLEIKLAYGDEVINGLVTLGLSDQEETQVQFARNYLTTANELVQEVSSSLSIYTQKGTNVVIWGGTGKAATFIQHFNLTKELFPLVVDSDTRKVGFFVPGTGQEIMDPEILCSLPPAVILIPTQWRANDIVSEINRRSLPFKSILIEHAGKLVSFFDDHPYK